MDTTGQPLLVGDSLEEAGEGFLFFGSECCEERIVMLARDFSYLFEGLLPFGGDLEGVGAPVVGVALADEEAEGFHLIDDTDQTAGMHAKLGGEFALAYSGGMGETAEDSGVRGR
jgi:hypothetical protein